MTQRKPRLLLMSTATILLAGCASIAAPGSEADAAAFGPLSLQQQAAQVKANRVEIMFPPRRAALSSEDTRQLDLLARLIRQVDPVTLFTTAYGESGASGGADLALSARRAMAVKRGLIARGIPDWQLRVQSISLPAGREPSPGVANSDCVTISWGTQ